MALIHCPECQREISDNAMTCPGCGIPIRVPRTKAPPRQYGCGTFLILLLIMSFMLSVYEKYTHDPADDAPAKSPRTQRIESQFSIWNGAHRNLEKTVKAGLKDPDSYQHIETHWFDKGDYLTVVMQYRAKNSFGGYVVETATANCSLDGVCSLPSSSP